MIACFRFSLGERDCMKSLAEGICKG